jgi:hypothetical protein
MRGRPVESLVGPLDRSYKVVAISDQDPEMWSVKDRVLPA